MLTPSADRMIQTTDDHMKTDTNAIAKFADQEPVKAVTVGQPIDFTRYFSAYNDASLSDWYSRPVELFSANWQLNTPFFSAFEPWNSFVNNASVKRKLSNYTYFTGKMHIKILINGTSFHYGKLCAAYLPLKELNINHFPPASADYVGLANLTKYSNLQHLYLDPVNNNSGVLCLPFIYPNDMIAIDQLVNPVASSDRLGTLILQSFADLRAASSTPVPEVSVQILGWMSDVVLSGPTATTYSGMADDDFLDPTPAREYTGVLSSPLSLAAKAAGALRKVPVIGTEANLVSSVLSVSADVAAYFGFSRPINMTTPSLMKRYPFSSTANVIGTDNANKLAFDPKHNVTIDPSINAQATDDNLALCNFTRMWNFTNKFTWTNSQAHDTIIGYAYVYPVDAWHTTVLNGGLNNDAYTMTTLGYASIPFKFWSGTIEYRIRFVSSKYHTGRIKITYNPSQVPAVAEFNSEYNWIIDLAKDTDIVIKIPWNQPVSYKGIGDRIGLVTDAALGNIGSYDSNAYNGVLTFSVVNELVSPFDGADVDILIDKRGGTDFELFAPINSQVSSGEQGKRYWLMQPVPSALSGSADDTFTELQMFGREKTEDELTARATIYSGESIPSFRTLLKRYMRATVFYSTQSLSAADMAIFTFIHQKMLPFVGPSAVGRTTTAAGTQYTYGNTTLLQYLSWGFVGHRGSIRYKYNPSFQSVKPYAMRAYRDYNSSERGVPLNWSTVAQVDGATEAEYQFNVMNLRHDPGWTGSLLTSAGQQMALEVDYPYYSNQRYLGNDIYTTTSTTSNMYPHGSLPELCCIEVIAGDDGIGSNRQCSIEVWQATGEDFSFVHWLGPPIVYAPQSLPPPSV